MAARTHRCDCCRTTDATFEVSTRRVRPGHTKETKGMNAPWETQYLCEPCVNVAIQSDDPPRRVTVLPHHVPPETAEPVPVNGTLGDDWGRR